MIGECAGKVVVYILGVLLAASLLFFGRVTTWVGLGICFAAGFAGASWGRRFHQGILAVFATIMAGFVLAIVGGPLSVVGISMARGIDLSQHGRRSRRPTASHVGRRRCGRHCPAGIGPREAECHRS
jgi:hypothetical protein